MGPSDGAANRADAPQQVVPGRISVLIPAHNHVRWVEESIRSVGGQTWPDVELIVIDDGSSDGTAAAARAAIAELPATIGARLIEQSNVGLCRTLNRGLALCTGEFLQVLASDDALELHKFEQQGAALLAAEPDVVGVFGDMIAVDEFGQPGMRLDYAPRNRFGDLFLDFLMAEQGLSTQCALFRLQTVRDAGGFNEAYRTEDVDLFLRLLRAGSLKYTGSVVVRYRVLNSGMSASLSAYVEEVFRIRLAHFAEAPERFVGLGAHAHRRLEARCWARTGSFHIRSGMKLPAAKCLAHALMAWPADKLAWQCLGSVLIGPRLMGAVLRFLQTAIRRLP